MTDKISRFLAERQPATPCLVVDLDIVAENYRRLQRAFPMARIYYAVKANPAAEILRLLAGLGSCFDAASVHEVDACLNVGAPAESISFGNTIKKHRDIAHAYASGVRLFAFDAAAELDKLVAAAPGVSVFCRLTVAGDGAGWPMSDKFGCDLAMARDLLISARDRGLDPCGVSFHVGSQQSEPGQWDLALAKTAMLFSELDEAGVVLRMVNIGGGFPARYRAEIPAIDAYAHDIFEAMARHFGNRMPEMAMEPGRCIAADAGIIQSEVVLVSRKSYGDARRWVYLDIGKFGGLAETMGEAIQYPIRTPHDGGAAGPVVIAGPTCDGADILYAKARYELPMALDAGDKVEILGTGAYTASYASVGFNGFPPPKTYFV